MSFLAPMMLTGLALASLPIIIHLLNRRRFVVVDWAPMKHLKLTLKNNRRRLRIEQLLLLLVRTLAIVALVLAVARPFVTTGASGSSLSGAASLLAGKGRTARVLVLDDSLSMGYEGEKGQAFGRARDFAAELLRIYPSQDAVTFMLASSPGVPILRDARGPQAAALANTLSTLRPSDTAAAWSRVLRAAEETLESSPFPAREVILLTDLRRAGWDDSVTAVAQRLGQRGVRLVIVDKGSRKTENAAVVALRADEPLALPGGEVKLTAEVRNAGPAPLPPAQAVLWVDGASRPVAIPEASPGQTVRVPLTATFPEPGPHGVRLVLPTDPLAADNERRLSVPVRAAVNVVLIDGEPSDRLFDGETDFAAAALTVGAEPWHTTRLTDADWSLAADPPALVAADIIVIANVASPTAEQASVLERLVNAGAGLLIFPGDLVDPAVWNERLHRDGLGLLPAKLERVADEPVTGLAIEPLADSALDPLSKLAPAALARVQPRKYLRVGPIAASNAEPARKARVLARWNDRDGAPACIEKPFGQGRAFLFTVTADPQWSDWPKDPTYVLALRCAARSAVRSLALDTTQTAGLPLRHTFPAGFAPLEPRVTAPHLDAPQQPIVESAPAGNAPAAVTLRFDDTLRAGTYTLRWKDSQGKADQVDIAVNPDPAESDLESIDDAQLNSLLGSLRPTILREDQPTVAGTPDRAEFWKPLAMTLLALLMFEPLLTAWISRDR